MKIFIILTLVSVTQFVLAATDEIPCAAVANGNEILLEKSASGLYMIAIEDPYFDEYDVVVDMTDAKAVKVRLAKFIPTSLVAGLKAELALVSESVRAEILKLAKARVIDATMGFNSSGQATLSLLQGDDRLELYCTRNP